MPKQFRYCLDDAENYGPVDLQTPTGPVQLRYMEDDVTWVFVILRNGNVVDASHDDERIIKSLKAEGVSFRRGG